MSSVFRIAHFVYRRSGSRSLSPPRTLCRGIEIITWTQARTPLAKISGTRRAAAMFSRRGAEFELKPSSSNSESTATDFAARICCWPGQQRDIGLPDRLRYTQCSFTTRNMSLDPHRPREKYPALSSVSLFSSYILSFLFTLLGLVHWLGSLGGMLRGRFSGATFKTCVTFWARHVRRPKIDFIFLHFLAGAHKLF